MSLPRFCKHCRVLGHTDSICTRVGGNKQKKYIQTTSSSMKLHQNSGCSSCVSSVETAVMEQQQVYYGKSHGEPCLDPMCPEVAAVVESWAEVPGPKKAKNFKVGQAVHASSLPGVVYCAPSNIVHVIDDFMQDVVVAEGGEPSRGRKHYMTCSRRLAASTATGGQHVKAGVAVVFKGSGFVKDWSGAGHRTQGRHADSDPPSPFL